MTMSEKLTGGAGGSPKQKIIAIAVVIIFIIIIWQVIGMFRNNDSSPAIAPAPTTAASSGAMTAAKPATGASISTANNTAQAQTEMNVVPVHKEAEMYKLQQEAQQKYITSLNELQTLRIQKEIAETNQAIASAKLATVSAEKNIAELLTKPTVPTLPPSAYTSTSNSPGSPQFSSSPPVSSVEVASSASIESEAQYVLISVSMQLNKWNAVIGYRGKPYQVSVGTILPPDGSQISSITSNAVVLEKNGRKRTITLVPPV